jgi:hypothetical protein
MVDENSFSKNENLLNLSKKKLKTTYQNLLENLNRTGSNEEDSQYFSPSPSVMRRSGYNAVRPPSG